MFEMNTNYVYNNVTDRRTPRFIKVMCVLDNFKNSNSLDSTHVTLYLRVLTLLVYIYIFLQ